MGCSKTRWKCIHNGECSQEFYYKIHTFVGGLEISVEDIDPNPTSSRVTLFDEQTISFPRLVILRPKGINHLKEIKSIEQISKYRKNKSLDEFVEIYKDLYSEPLSIETKQLYDFTSNCIFEILSEEDIPLLTELRSLYGPPEFLNSENNIDGNIIGNVLEKDESGILIINPWDSPMSQWGDSPSHRNSMRNETNIPFHSSELHKTNSSQKLDANQASIIGSQGLDFSGFSIASIKALAIFGILFVFEEPYLLVSTDGDISSVIYQNGAYKTINRVTKSLAIPLFSNSIETQFFNLDHPTTSQNEKDTLKLTTEFSKKQSELVVDHLKAGKNQQDIKTSKSSEKIEWINRVSSTLQKLSPIKGNKESFSLLTESGANWISNSLINVSSGILSTVSTALSNSINIQQSNPILSTSSSPTNYLSKDLSFSSIENLSKTKDSNSPLSLEELLIERRSHLERLIEGVTKMISLGGFFYSFDLDITHTLQTKFENSWIDHKERVGTLGENGETLSEMKNKAYIITGDSRFIWNRNISLPVLISGVDPRWITPLIQGYFCNQAIVISPEGPGYIKIGPDILSLRMNLINSFTDLDELFPQINKSTNSATCEQKCACSDNGMVACRHKFACKMCYRDYVDSLTRYDIVLMSRRSWERGGTRFNARGIDENANVANFVESELQICINNSDHWFAFTQIRGSIPLFWEQTGVNSCAITCFDHDYSSYMFEKHHVKLVKQYGEVFYVNLLGSSAHEQALSLGLKKEINYYNLNIESKYDNIKYSEDSETGLVCDCKKKHESNQDDFCFCSCKAIPIVYTNYDYHQKVKNQGFESALNEYVSILAKDFGDRIGYFHGVFSSSNSKPCSETTSSNNQEPVSFANLLDLDDFETREEVLENSNNSLVLKVDQKSELVIKMRQKGVIRTNCLDCLDRTNALQWYIAWTWFVDLILSISTCSLESNGLQNKEKVSNISQEGFVKSLLNSQLSHFGWFQLILNSGEKSQTEETNILEIINGKNLDQILIPKSVNSSLSSSLRNQTQSKVMRSPLTLSNPIIPSKINKGDFETRSSSIQTECRDIGQRHLFIMKKSAGKNYNSSVSISNLDMNRNISTMDLDDYRSKEFSQSNKRNLSSFEIFRNCLLNGMGVVTLKDSFSLLWAENGDVISEHYTGAGSVFSGVIKNRKVSLSTNLDHAVKSLRRLYHNTFEDSSRQQYIDCLLYKHPSNSNILGQTDDLFKGNLSKKSVQVQSLPESLSLSSKDLNNEKLTIWICSWNLGGQTLNVGLDAWIEANLPKNTSIVCFCVQEIVELSSVRVMFNQNDKNREATFEMLALQSLGADKYVKLHSISLVGLFCVVFVRRSFHRFVKSVESNSMKLGLMGNTGNKGAVMIRMNIERYGSIVLTNVHLVSGEQYREERNSQLKLILQSSVFNEIPNFKGFLRSGASLQDHDLVILAGDFNFRIQLPKQKVMDLIKEQNLSELLKFDQFFLEKKSDNEIMSKLFEGEISFLPTYKYIRGEYSYDPSRTPSWCDRIFVLSKGSELSRITDTRTNQQDDSFDFNCLNGYTVSIIDYKSDQKCQISDHHPVFAVITVQFD
ncbi:phosphatidylinositol phosphate phosphatase [Cryptosporidium ubiquitum]|uniref:phosphoinositide 5-phosphatase n=1 Tax=Cryptosporidium ubiquitum TaxID=857276 RepID=A0A1J4MDW6_9CRYT|nr:phosphatidylinositol phosphate phosphatase [Cryptosporidium ubiquitum]OII72409.1 phosphatidylinositol phosphate phosphatase [Cryptosporidium ubiquitum]